MKPLVRLQGLARTYAGPPPVAALGPTDLDIAYGDYLAIVGPSGSGKSTLLNLLGLIDRPTAGTYELAGVDTAAMSERDRTTHRARHIGLVFQSFHLLPHRTAQENVELGLLYRGVRAMQRRERAHETLRRVGLAHRVSALPSRLSGGERQRVAIARALVGHPTLLLCDEPTGNLDSVTAGTVLEVISELHRTGLTVVMITHDHGVAARAGRVASIVDGTLTERPRSGVPG